MFLFTSKACDTSKFLEIKSSDLRIDFLSRTIAYDCNCDALWFVFLAMNAKKDESNVDVDVVDADVFSGRIPTN